jgi:hypothetical protein
MPRSVDTWTFVLALGLTACAREQADQQRADTTAPARPVVTTTPVNDGTYGMSAQVRWAFSADRRGILVVVDPVGVEAEPVANGFFFGLEQPAFAVQVDTVWDVAPSPDWRSVAYSRAYVLSSGEADSVPGTMWDQLARETGIDVMTLRTASFAASGMAYARGVAQPAIIRVPPDPRARYSETAARPQVFAIPRGWRVRWTQDGTTLALGANPRQVQDHTPSVGWSALDPQTGQLHGSLPSTTRLAEPQWVRGPELYFGMTVDFSTAPTINVKQGGLNYLIESQRGVISLRDPAFETHAAIPVGPGIALAATAGGRYIVALAPRSRMRPNELPVEVVVYTVTL